MPHFNTISQYLLKKYPNSYNKIAHINSTTSQNAREAIVKGFNILIDQKLAGNNTQEVRFLILNRRVRGEGLNLISSFRAILFKPASLPDYEGQYFGRVYRCGQKHYICHTWTLVGQDDFNPINLVILHRRLSTEKIIKAVQALTIVDYSLTLEEDDEDKEMEVQIVQL